MGADDHQTVRPITEYGSEDNSIKNPSGVTSTLDRAIRAVQDDAVFSWFEHTNGDETTIIMTFKDDA